MGKLTDLKCRTAKCAGQKIIKLGDGEGLYLWVHASGRKNFHFRYTYDGKPKGLHLGDYPHTSLSDARKEARKLRDILDEGIDPSKARQAVIRENKTASDKAFEVVGREWYSKQSPSWAPKHAADVLRRLEVNIFPHIGSRPIDEIGGPEMLMVISKIEGRGATDLAHRVNSNCGQIFRYGIAKGLCKFDIAASIVDAMTPHQKKNQPAVQTREIAKLMQAISTYHEIGDEQTQLGLKVLAHTFTRTTEFIGAKWEEFHFDESIWEIPGERMKLKRPHLVPLSKQVVAYLVRLKELARSSEYVMPGRTILKHVSNNTLLFALYRLGYKGRMTGHGFRAMASTVLNEAGWDSDWIEKQLAHEEENKVRGAYNRAQYMRGRKSMMDWWSDYLDAAEKGERLPSPPHAAA
jgi:integrase